jgi:hypothetical protein
MSRAHYRTGAIFSAVPIEPIRALMNRNSNPDAPRIIFTRIREKRPGAGRRKFCPYGRSWQRPGGDVGPLACSAPANSNVLAGFLTGEVRAAAPPSGTPSREPQGCIDCSEPASDHSNLGRRIRRTAPATSRQPGRKVSHDYPRHFPEFLPLAPPRTRPARGRVRPAAVIRAGAGVQERRLGPRRGMIDTAPNPRPPAQVRSNVPRGAMRSSTARYFILYRIKVT